MYIYKVLKSLMILLNNCYVGADSGLKLPFNHKTVQSLNRFFIVQWNPPKITFNFNVNIDEKTRMHNFKC